MASGNSSDPPDGGERGPRRPSQASASENQVAEQTEEVFESYVFYRYQQEREQNEADVPVDPEITEMQQRPDSINSQVGRRLATIGDDINMRYDKEFCEMLKSLQPTRDNAYEYFTRIASSQAALLLPLCHLEVVCVLQPGKLTSSAFPSLLFSGDVCFDPCHSVLCLLNLPSCCTHISKVMP
ncbi:bcl-2 homologous antagonist/killer isoform X2 [Tiliqua scincoides]|uniref:bcl-2 homologous antagonist/killer isoform X2 n=1 Tax=Tiliqua scincoides TaxID=71010 RepID=UPI003461FE75